MVPLNRRRFLVTASGAAAAAALARQSASQPTPLQLGSDSTALAATTTEDLKNIKHVVILMQENHSFDHYFGTLKGVRGFDDQSVIELPGTSTAPSKKSIFHQPDTAGPNGERWPWALNHGQQNGWKQAQGVETGHYWTDTHNAWNNGRLDKWIRYKGVRTMGYLTKTDIPFHHSLANNYTICDGYHCSVLGSTGNNRNYLWSGTVGAGLGSPYETPESREKLLNLANWDGTDFDQSWRAFAQELQDVGISYKTYNVENDNFNNNALEYFTAFDPKDPNNATRYANGVKSVPAVAGAKIPRDKKTMENIIQAIKKDVNAGTLPQVSYVVTDVLHSEWGRNTPSRGGEFINNLLGALSGNKAVLQSTVLFITYDENDGFFDHVPPPVPPVPPPLPPVPAAHPSYQDQLEWVSEQSLKWVNPKPIGLGMRVPMIVVSPWTTGGRVCSQTFDHTSVIQFLEKWTDALGKVDAAGNKAKCSYISDWRRKVCGDLTSVFDFNKDASAYTLPTLDSPYLNGEPDAVVYNTAGAPVVQSYSPTPTSVNVLPAQEPGTKVACALPYQPNVYLESVTGGRAYVVMQNEGSVATEAVQLAAYANAYRADGPWQHVIDAHSSKSGSFGLLASADFKYDLTFIGPNRFMRRFVGKQGVSVSVRSEIAPGNIPNPKGGPNILALILILKNGGTSPAIFRIKGNYYRTFDKTYEVAAGSVYQPLYFNQVHYENFQGWYDFTITVNTEPSWEERYVGHIETGKPSITGGTWTKT